MAKRKAFAQNSKAFMVTEAMSTHGGFPKFMNDMMERMRAEMLDAGHMEPFMWRFSGGDGVTVPVHIHCEVT